ncbi:hypothetical protein GG344DRAFT_62327 [Lentinula edodes]|nr:hypothetical protein GG344DRAFT_62327 [Lentinula edodes]
MKSTIVQHVSAAQQQQLEDYFHLFSIKCVAFLYWDHLITFPDEIQYLWKRSMGWSTALFFFNRYFAALGNIVVTVSLFSSGLTESRYGEILQAELPQPITLQSAADHFIYFAKSSLFLLTIRIYALYHCSRRMLIYMLVTGFTLGGLSIYISNIVIQFAIFFGQSSQSVLTPTGCHTQLTLITPSDAVMLRSIQVAAAWEALFLYDSMLFVMTLHKAYKTRYELRQERLRIPLVVIILRDGSIYFGILIYLAEAKYAQPFLRGALCTFASRLMLNLHEISETGLYTSHITTCQLGTYSAFVASPPDSANQITFDGRGTNFRCKEHRGDGGRGIEEEVTTFIEGTKGAPQSKESPEIILASDSEGTNLQTKNSEPNSAKVARAT